MVVCSVRVAVVALCGADVARPSPFSIHTLSLSSSVGARVGGALATVGLSEWSPGAYGNRQQLFLFLFFPPVRGTGGGLLPSVSNCKAQVLNPCRQENLSALK
uniref:Uncharacterized protein n=1 Tax=Micrurus spixii TaxID=129469 RepID=A0A2D4MED6_9SAUR